jgi:hypothetical protein
MANLALGEFDHDLGATVAAQMYEVCDRLPRRSFRRRWCDTGSSRGHYPVLS